MVNVFNIGCVVFGFFLITNFFLKGGEVWLLAEVWMPAWENYGLGGSVNNETPLLMKFVTSLFLILGVANLYLYSIGVALLSPIVMLSKLWK